MTLFWTILIKIFPLYINVLLGYASARLLHVQRESIANLLIYILGPIVVFSATLSVKINFEVILLPILLYTFSSLLAFATLFVFGKSWNDPTGNILAFSAGTGNTGYFGIPLAIIFFPPPLADIYIFTVLSSLLYESTTGFYVTAKGNFSVKQSLLKIAKLPLIYAFLLGLLLNLAHFSIPTEISQYTAQFKGAYGILGMMMLGMGLSGLKAGEGHLDTKFISIAFIIKFLLWPLAITVFIYMDRTFLNLFDTDLHKVLFLFSIVPLAGNSVTLAVLLNAKPEKISIAVFLSTLLSILFIPAAIALYGDF